MHQSKVFAITFSPEMHASIITSYLAIRRSRKFSKKWRKNLLKAWIIAVENFSNECCSDGCERIKQFKEPEIKAPKPTESQKPNLYTLASESRESWRLISLFNFGQLWIKHLPISLVQGDQKVLLTKILKFY